MRQLMGLMALASALACAGPAADEANGSGAPEGRSTFEWSPVDVSGQPSRWGAYTVERESDTLVLGGVLGDGSAVLDSVFSSTPGDAAVTTAADVSMDQARYCHCAMWDEARQTLVVIGGRDASFTETESAVAVDTDSGATSVLEDNGAAAHPVGCQALFFPALGRGYVFGGLSGARRAFGSTTYRYDADTRSFTALEIPGPAGRYDAATHVLEDGTALMVGGMGLAGVSIAMFSDVWRFDPEEESWTELPIDGAVPPGRRYPWTAVSPDESILLFGFGSDSGMGTTVLGDLWGLSLDSQRWSALELPTGPAPRGFAYRWKGTDAMAGILAFGFDGTTGVTDGWGLLVPDDQVGKWH